MRREHNRTRIQPTSALGAAVLIGALLTACSEEGSGGIIFQSRNTGASAAGGSLVRVSERWLLFQADEFTTGAGGTDFNGDGDKTDLIAVVVNMVDQQERNLAVAADDLAILGTGTGAHLYIVVDEAKDGTDWNSDSDMTDVVLLHLPALDYMAASLAPVATLSGGGSTPILVAGDRLYFVEDPSAGSALLSGETAINYVSVSMPLVGERVLHDIVAADTGTQLVDVLEEPDLVATDGDLIFFTMDENSESPLGGGGPGVNLNGGLPVPFPDSDMTDENVLGVFEASAAAPLALNVGLALAGDSEPVRAADIGSGQSPEILVAFLVSEADQGDLNLNVAGAPDLPGNWKPSQCSSDDADTLDTVLFYMEYFAWLADPLANRAANTGLAGKDRALAIANGNKRFVATISDEAEAECDLNDDGDTTDEVFRFAPVGGGTAYVTSPQALLAIESVNGGVEGVTDMSERFLAVISESDNEVEINGDPPTAPGFENDDLIGWLNPGAVTTSTPLPWVFDHSPSPGVQAAGTDWMTERPQRDRMPVTFQESLLGQSINTGGDNDADDSAPSFARFDPIDDLDFPGPPIAARAGNAGIVLSANNLAFFRVDEAADNRDWNGDGDKSDLVLFRTTVSTLQNSNFLAVLNGVQRPAAELGGTIGAAYLADESMAGVDFNQDGDMTDLVLRWFRIG